MQHPSWSMFVDQRRCPGREGDPDRAVPRSPVSGNLPRVRPRQAQPAEIGKGNRHDKVWAVARPTQRALASGLALPHARAERLRSVEVADPEFLALVLFKM